MAHVPDNTLLTPTAEDRRALPLKLARLTIKAIQPDQATRELLRPGYDTDPDSLTMAPTGSLRVHHDRGSERRPALRTVVTGPLPAAPLTPCVDLTAR